MKVKPAARPLILCQRLHSVLCEYRSADDTTAAQSRLFQLFAECGPPASWTWAVWPNHETRSAVCALFGAWVDAANTPMTAAMWEHLVDTPDEEYQILLDRSFAACGDPSEWPDFPQASPDLKRFLSERFTAFQNGLET